MEQDQRPNSGRVYSAFGLRFCGVLGSLRAAMNHRNPSSILITGASSGLGAALAIHYAKPGITLHLGGRDAERLGSIAETCRNAGASVEIGVVDIVDATAVRSWIEAADGKRPLDLVIANAGISGGTGGHGEGEANARRIFAVNLDGVLNTVHPALERMLPRKSGQIGLMSSLAGFRGMPGAPAYSASKAAVLAYAEALRGAHGKDGIAVSAICPGFVKSPMTDVNTFPMPFLMPADKAARIIAKGLAADRGLIAFPLPMRLMTAAIARLPSALGTALLSRLPEKS